MDKFKLVVLIILAIASTNVLAEDTPNFTIAGYYSDANKLKPLILNSKDYGVSWRFNTTVPNIDANTKMNDAGCILSTCLAVGSIEKANATTQPFLMRHGYKSVTWEIIPMDNAFNFDTAQFDKVTCSYRSCFVIGTGTKDGKSQALLYVSDTEGKSWTSANLKDISVIHSLTDSDRYFVGFFEDNAYPVHSSNFVYSKDGITWTKAVVDNASFTQFIISDLKCHMNYCVAVGNRMYRSERLPALLESSDSGKHWRYLADVVTDDTELQAVTYSSYWGVRWVIAGAHILSGGTKDPLFLYCNDADGESWSLAQSNVALPDNGRGYEIKSINCPTYDCVAVGKVETINQKQNLIVMTSNNAGHNWQRSTDVPTSLSTSTLNNIKLYCTYSYCAMIMPKDLSNPTLKHDYPEILTTNDHGLHWFSVNNVVDMPTTEGVSLTGLSGSEF